jgi:hypothetical protein
MTEPDETPEDDREELTLDLSLTKTNGVKVPVSLVIKWPTDEGMSAIGMLGRTDAWLEKVQYELLQHLANTGDASMIAAAARMQDDDEYDDGYGD